MGQPAVGRHPSRHDAAGVLTVRLPVTEQAKPRKVSITTGAGQHASGAGAQAA